MKVPADLTTLIQRITAEFPLLFGRNLVGVYLYGSVNNSSFNPARSDVDCLVVTRRDLSDAQFRKLDDWLKQAEEINEWTARLQVSFLIRDQVLTMNARACNYQLGVLKRGTSDGNPIIWLDYLRSGKILFGPPPESFLPKITPDILFEALVRELGYLREEIIEKPQSEWRDLPMYRAYAVVTICRILYSWEKGTITSKPLAAKWAIRNLPERWSGIIYQALDFNNNNREIDIPLRHIEEFISFAKARVVRVV